MRVFGCWAMFMIVSHVLSWWEICMDKVALYDCVFVALDMFTILRSCYQDYEAYATTRCSDVFCFRN